ncbi:MAG: hypothetical protein WAT79_16010 [Saprospiraceae bacterium]
MPKQFAMALSFSIALLFAVNVIVSKNYNYKPNVTQEYALSIHLLSNHTLYE